MKKIKALVLILTVAVCLCSCSSGDTPVPDASQTPGVPAPAETSSAVAATPVQQPAQEPVIEETETAAEDKGEAVMKTYKALLCGDQDFVIGKDISGFEEGESLRLPDFAEKYCKYVNEEWGMDHNCSISYGYLDCGSDGIPELSLKLTLTDEENFESLVRLFIINCPGDTPVMTGDYDYYYRSYTDINIAGLVQNGGSSGAASHYSDYRYINAAGEEQFLFSVSTEMANPRPAIPPYFLPPVFGDDYYDMFAYEDADTYYTVDAFSFSEFNAPEDSPAYDAAYEEYCRSYFFTITDDSGNDVEPDAEFAPLYAENGIRIVSAEEADRMIKERFEEAGVTDEIRNADYVTYKKLDVDQLSDEIIENEDGSITVGCTANLIENIKDGATIFLKPGVYNLTDWLHRYADSFYGSSVCRAYPNAEPYNDRIFAVYDQLIVNRVNGLTIASLAPEDPAEIVIDDQFSLVMSFCECSDLTLNNVIAGHTPGNEGHCSADVFEFFECDRVTLNDCDLYGCGCYGIMARQTVGLDVNGGRIHDCTSGMAELYGTTQVTFTGTAFENCNSEWGSMFYLTESNADFYGCTFRNLGDMFSLDASSAWMTDCIMDDDIKESIENNEKFEQGLYMYRW